MALKATIFKADLQVSDLDRGYYARHALTIARHPSETDERMMVRLVAFAFDADEMLSFGRGLSTEDEADLALTDHSGAIDLWIDVGQPDERDLRKAAGRARRVKLWTYGGRVADIWWEQNRGSLERLRNLEVFRLSGEDGKALAALADRTMKVEVTIQDGAAWVSAGDRTLRIEPGRLKDAAPA
ncbi:MAG TPA: YaeQ family protein [Rhodocyclaceae bacterium]|nr:YaeQ family protein [Rhodocyclaceae bacterium]